VRCPPDIKQEEYSSWPTRNPAGEAIMRDHRFSQQNTLKYVVAVGLMTTTLLAAAEAAEAAVSVGSSRNTIESQRSDGTCFIGRASGI
jgi:hypothetical protein